MEIRFEIRWKKPKLSIHWLYFTQLCSNLYKMIDSWWYLIPTLFKRFALWTEIIYKNLNFRSARPSGYNFTTVKAQPSGSGVAFLTDLKKYRKYGVVIQAFNEKGPGPMSSEIVTQTLEDGVFHFRDFFFRFIFQYLFSNCINATTYAAGRKQVFITIVINCIKFSLIYHFYLLWKLTSWL